MAEVRFTEQQQMAIDTLDKSILVSAAAGSGKTAVLVERIINIILQGKSNVDEMLVVTFTSAAAAEMKLKLTKAIKKRIIEDPSSEAMLSVQLDRMYRSYISTFHSFAMRIIKEFFYKLDMEPNFQICDEIQGTILQLEAVDELFEEGFANDSFIEGLSFRDFLRAYSSDRNEDGLKKAIVDNYKKLRSMPDYMNWAFEKAEDLNVDMDNIEGSAIYQRLGEAIVRDIHEALEAVNAMVNLLEEYGLETMIERLKPEIDAIKAVSLDIKTNGMNQDAFSNLSGINYTRLVARKEEKPDYEQIKDSIKVYRDTYKNLIKNIGKNYTEPSLEARFEELKATYEYAVYYIRLMQRFEELFAEKKRERNLLDFSDIEHTAAKILEDPEASEVVRNRFKYIFIDEYQDTNKLQEYLISRFARADNVFKVGDVKQSIYGFRQSDPKIFMSVREDYSSDANENAITIDLNKNFRSNGKTIDYVNDIFGKVMEGYDDAAKLYNGTITEEPYDFMPEVHILFDENVDDSESDDDDENISSSEAEAAHVAKLVNSIIGTEFYDSKSGIVRKATARDIVILMRGVKSHADAYYKAMLEYNIPAHVNDEEGYFDTIEVEVALSLLRVIDNMRQDVPLIAVLRSEIFGFSAEELSEVRAAYREAGNIGSYYNAFKSYIETCGDTPLGQKCKLAFDMISEWKTLSGLMPLSDFVWHVLTESGYYLYAGAMYGGRQRQANLRVLAERAESYQDSTIATLGGFIRYMDFLKAKNVKTGQAIMVSEEDDVVRIMTIHKSKGLEFPFVIVAGIGRQLNRSKGSKGFMVDSDVGVAISYVNREEKFWRPTIMQRIINEKVREEEYQEELRVLYVAVTRPRQKLYLTGTIKNREKLESEVAGRGKYLDIIKQSISTKYNELKIVDAEPIAKGSQVNLLEHFLAKRKHFKVSDNPDLYEEISRRLSYEYPNKQALETRAKYSVSELRALKEDREYMRRISLVDPEFKETAAVSGADVGTGYHRIMETVDFCKALNGSGVDKDYIESVAEGLRESGAIEADVFEHIKLNKIHRFFESEVGERAVAAAKNGVLFKEKPFTMKTEHEGHDVLVQGIIDCCFIENDKYILVDYKSNYVSDGISAVEDMYREQIELYRRALELGTGKEVAECYLYLFGLGKSVEIR